MTTVSHPATLQRDESTYFLDIGEPARLRVMACSMMFKDTTGVFLEYIPGKEQDIAKGEVRITFPARLRRIFKHSLKLIPCQGDSPHRIDLATKEGNFLKCFRRDDVETLLGMQIEGELPIRLEFKGFGKVERI